ncbi:MAG TPA: hypothetical protein VGD91_13155, partial [Trebonia sp.]
DTMRPVRPLELPDEQPARARRPRGATRGSGRTRRWVNWGGPVAAAALVTVLALVLVILRQAPVRPSGSAPAATGTAVPVPGGTAVLGSIPRYYVALAGAGGGSSQLKAVVGDVSTGKTVATLSPSARQNFYGVTGAADDRTFVVLNYDNATGQTTWYRLRLTPGAARPARLTRLPIKPVVAHIAGLALAPDGRELAVMWRSATTQSNAVTCLAVYSMTSGAALHTWITKGDNYNTIGGGSNGEALAWVDGGRSIDFRWTVITAGAHGRATQTVRRIDVTASGPNLLSGSRVAVPLPPGTTVTKAGFSVPCDTSVTAGDGTVVCGTTSYSDVSFQEVCSKVPPAFVTYSGTTGKQLKVLYSYHGQCLEAQATPVWTDSAARHVVAFLLLSEKDVKTSATDRFGLVTDGHFIPLPKLVVGDGNAISPGGLAF